MLVVMRLAIGYWLLAIGRYGRYRMLDIRREAVRWMELTSKVRHGNATQHRSEAGGWRRWWRNYLPSRELARSRRVASLGRRQIFFWLSGAKDSAGKCGLTVDFGWVSSFCCCCVGVQMIDCIVR